MDDDPFEHGITDVLIFIVLVFAVAVLAAADTTMEKVNGELDGRGGQTPGIVAGDR